MTAKFECSSINNNKIWLMFLYISCRTHPIALILLVKRNTIKIPFIRN